MTDADLGTRFQIGVNTAENGPSKGVQLTLPNGPPKILTRALGRKEQRVCSLLLVFAK